MSNEQGALKHTTSIRDENGHMNAHPTRLMSLTATILSWACCACTPTLTTEKDQDYNTTTSFCIINFTVSSLDYDSAGKLIMEASSAKNNGCKKMLLNISINNGSHEAAVIAANGIKALNIEVLTNNLSEISLPAMALYCTAKRRYAEKNSYFNLSPLSYSFNKSSQTNIQTYITVTNTVIQNSIYECPSDFIEKAVKSNNYPYLPYPDAYDVGIVNTKTPTALEKPQITVTIYKQ